MIQAVHQAYLETLPTTPMFHYPVLQRTLAKNLPAEKVVPEILVKHENMQPTGAFKVRGGIALFALQAQEFGSGVITASTGNHAQSIAYGAGQAGIPATIVVPTWTPDFKVAAISAWGANVVRAGETLSESVAWAQQEAERQGWSFISSVEEEIIAGHAGVYLEMLTAQPDLSAIFVPIGSGSGAAGATIVRDAIAPNCAIIGVQSAQAPAAFRAWQNGAPATIGSQTRAAGLATCCSYDRPQEIMRGLDAFITVDDAELDSARCTIAAACHSIAEGAGAASLAGIRVWLDPARATDFVISPTGRLAEGADSLSKLGMVISGGNADREEITSFQTMCL